jgi:prolyl-tRNA synthetase
MVHRRLRKAELMDYSSVKGFIIYRLTVTLSGTNSNYLNKRFKGSACKTSTAPLIPESLLTKKKSTSKVLPPKLIATIGGKSRIDDPLIIRPTSEVLFCEHIR